MAESAFSGSARTPCVRGNRFGHYDVTALIGEGGMGQVWRATDTQLNRDVALKILPDPFAADPCRVARFHREAQILASLNHPNIAQIHGIEESEGAHALVLELVEGQTLADCIAQRPIPLDEALLIAKQIAEALEAAHEAGVIHCDLKPANIKVRADGTVKVLDFGLATTLAGDRFDVDLSQAPTVTATTPGTRHGAILGTAAYMSPEQARGMPLDRRTDIWSFGCVVYEVLTARRAFPGDTLPDTLVGILEREPSWEALPDATPEAVSRLLRRCLQKHAARRTRDIGDARIELDEVVRGDRFDEGPTMRGAYEALRSWRSSAVSVVVACVAVTALSLSRVTGPDDPAVSRLSTSEAIATQLTNHEWSEAASALAPDGRAFAFVSDHAGTPDVWLRQVSGGELVRLTDDAETESNLVFAPSGEAIYFERAGAILRIGTLGGQARTMVARGFSPSPSPDGQRLAYYVREADKVALTVGALDGSATTTLVEGIIGGSQSVPAWSPDGRFIAYTLAGLFTPSNLFVVDVDTAGIRQVTRWERHNDAG